MRLKDDIKTYAADVAVHFAGDAKPKPKPSDGLSEIQVSTIQQSVSLGLNAGRALREGFRKLKLLARQLGIGEHMEGCYSIGYRVAAPAGNG